MRVRCERTIDDAIRRHRRKMRAVIDGLEAPRRGIARMTAVTLVAELGELSRFSRAPQLMGFQRLGRA